MIFKSIIKTLIILVNINLKSEIFNRIRVLISFPHIVFTEQRSTFSFHLPSFLSSFIFFLPLPLKPQLWRVRLSANRPPPLSSYWEGRSEQTETKRQTQVRRLLMRRSSSVVELESSGGGVRHGLIVDLGEYGWIELKLRFAFWEGFVCSSLPFFFFLFSLFHSLFLV